MRSLGVLCLLLVSCGVDSEVVHATRRDGLTQVTGFGSNPGNLSLFLHEPANRPASAPLVIALHGCSQTAVDYEAVGWNAIADANGFLVAYPQTSANGGCFNWFDTAQQSRTGTQVTSLLQIVQHLVSTRGVDASRVYVTGLSAGGAMVNVLLAVAGDVFLRGQVLAGIPFGCASGVTSGYSCMFSSSSKTPEQWGALVHAVNLGLSSPPVQLWHGTSDFTVTSANLQEQVDQWTNVNGIDVIADDTQTIGVATRRRFNDMNGVTRVESWTMASTGHGAPIDPMNGCGTTRTYMLDVDLCSAMEGARFFGLLDVVDAGVVEGDAGVDAGTEEVDAGVVVVVDAGVPDAGQPPVMTLVDAGTSGGGGVTVPQGCSATSMVLPLLGLLLMRRRKSA
ncbi:MAG: alpha/beta hydrolase family esterase [Archangium sp.]